MRFRALGRFASRFRSGDCPLILGLRVMSNLSLTGELPVSIIPLASGSDQSVSRRLCWQVRCMGATRQGGPIAAEPTSLARTGSFLAARLTSGHPLTVKDA